MLVAALALVAAGCGGGREQAAAPPPAPELRVGVPDAAAEAVLRRYVAAARTGDMRTLWRLLTPEAQAATGASQAAFGAGEGRRIHDGFRAHVGPARVLLARRLGDRAVAAVAAERRGPDGIEPHSHAIALARADGGWRVDLGAVHLDALEPDPLAVVGPRPLLGARATSPQRVSVLGAWLDGRPVRLAVEPTSPFGVRMAAPAAALAPGRHDLVVFAATADGAGAVGWPFVVADE